MGKSTVTLLGAEAMFFYQGNCPFLEISSSTVMGRTNSSGTHVWISSTS